MVDFSQQSPSRILRSLATSLAEAGLREDEATLFVWEGVIPYICLEAAARALRFMRRGGGSRSRVVFDMSDGLFDPSTPEQFVGEAGFPRLTAVGFDELWRRYLPGEPHPNAAMVRLGTAST